MTFITADWQQQSNIPKQQQYAFYVTLWTSRCRRAATTVFSHFFSTAIHCRSSAHQHHYQHRQQQRQHSTALSQPRLLIFTFICSATIAGFCFLLDLVLLFVAAVSVFDVLSAITGDIADVLSTAADSCVALLVTFRFFSVATTALTGCNVYCWLFTVNVSAPRFQCRRCRLLDRLAGTSNIFLCSFVVWQKKLLYPRLSGEVRALFAVPTLSSVSHFLLPRLLCLFQISSSMLWLPLELQNYR